MPPLGGRIARSLIVANVKPVLSLVVERQRFSRRRRAVSGRIAAFRNKLRTTAVYAAPACRQPNRTAAPNPARTLPDRRQRGHL
jgi:hypothetical protein